MTKEELIQHVKDCIESMDAQKQESRPGSYSRAYTDGYLEAAEHLLTKIRAMGETE